MLASIAIVFTAMVLVDYFYGKYTVAAAKHHAQRAAWWAVGIILANSFVVCEYVHNRWLVLVAAAGSWVGTYLGVRKSKAPESE